MRIKSLSIWIYSKTCLKRPLKRRSKIDFQDREHSAILSTFIKLPFAIKIFVLSNFWVTVEDRFYCRPVLGAQSNHLIETVLLSYTQNICFCWEIRKIFVLFYFPSYTIWAQHMRVIIPYIKCHPLIMHVLPPSGIKSLNFGLTPGLFMETWTHWVSCKRPDVFMIPWTD